MPRALARRLPGEAAAGAVEAGAVRRDSVSAARLEVAAEPCTHRRLFFLGRCSYGFRSGRRGRRRWGRRSSLLYFWRCIIASSACD